MTTWNKKLNMFIKNKNKGKSLPVEADPQMSLGVLPLMSLHNVPELLTYQEVFLAM